jgi:hypothetical protein
MAEQPGGCRGCHLKQIMAGSATLMVYFTAAKLWFYGLTSTDANWTVNGWC